MLQPLWNCFQSKPCESTPAAQKARRRNLFACASVKWFRRDTVTPGGDGRWAVAAPREAAVLGRARGGRASSVRFYGCWRDSDKCSALLPIKDLPISTVISLTRMLTNLLTDEITQNTIARSYSAVQQSAKLHIIIFFH